MSEQSVSIAYLGPKGTYSDEATHAFMAKMGLADADLLACASFAEVFDSVDRGKCTYGVVATENALEGPVTATLDNFAFNSPAQILGVHVVDIHHCLITHPDAKRSDKMFCRLFARFWPFRPLAYRAWLSVASRSRRQA